MTALFGKKVKKTKQEPVKPDLPDPEAEAKKQEETADRKRRASLAESMLFQNSSPQGPAVVQKTKLGQ